MIIQNSCILKTAHRDHIVYQPLASSQYLVALAKFAALFPADAPPQNWKEAVTFLVIHHSYKFLFVLSYLLFYKNRLDQVEFTKNLQMETIISIYFNLVCAVRYFLLDNHLVRDHAQDLSHLLASWS